MKDSKKKKKKEKEEYIPSDRLEVYIKVNLIEQLQEEGAKEGLTRNKMALLLITEGLKNRAQI